MKKITFIGDGKTKDFYFSFPYFTKKDIIVELNGAPATGFGLYCVSNGLNADIPFSGGRVCFTKPPKVASVISIYRKLELNRHVDYQPTKPINTMVLNQDMNFMLEALRDTKTELQDFADKYCEIIDKESTQDLLKRIDVVMAAIDNISQEIYNLGDISAVHNNISTIQDDISNIHGSIANLNESIVELNTELESANTNIDGLSSFRNGVLDYVVESQAPNADNNYTWYRKYVSGWVEMGGRFANVSSTGQINLSATMPIKVSPAHMMATPEYVNGMSVVVVTTFVSGQTITTTLEKNNATNTSNTTASARWFVCGQCVE